jgi:hypothetical protein
MRDGNRIGEAIDPRWRRRNSRTPAWRAIVAILIACLSAVAISPRMVTTPNSPFSTLNGSGAVCTIAPSQATVSSTVSQLQIPESAASAQAAMSATVSLYNFLCVNPVMHSLIALWGVQNLSLQTYSEGGVGVRFVNLSMQWDSWSNGSESSNQEFWAASTSNGSIQGPYASATGVGAAYGGVTTLQNASAWQFWGASTPTELYDTSGYTQVLSFSSEIGQQNDPAGTVADSAAAVWVGMSPTQGGASGGLLQTGYAYDASNPGANWCIGYTGSCDY